MGCSFDNELTTLKQVLSRFSNRGEKRERERERGGGGGVER